MSDKKKPRLFYYEEGVDGWVPAPTDMEWLVSLDGLQDGEVQTFSFKRKDMTDYEFKYLPES
ncbi:hypothetical protein M0R04_09220 [Candidatus Dojkabacteria bacterium]|jgi:hypothetical protein|nr:hypothetical protein [Candidatus Dojkabacteria bacterium]